MQMLNEFCCLTAAEESEFVIVWKRYEELVFKYAPLEKEKAIKKILDEYQAEESENTGINT